MAKIVFNTSGDAIGSTATVMGIDPSLTSTGVIVLDSRGEIVAKERITSKPSGPLVSSRMRRCQDIFNAVINVANIWQPSVITIEGYSLGSNMPGMVDRVELGGLLRYMLIAHGHRLVEVAPTTLKKWATGKGAWPGGGKTPLIVAMTSRYRVELGTDDEYDAYALARMALQIAEHDEPQNQHQREAIEVAINGRTKKPSKRKTAT